MAPLGCGVPQPCPPDLEDETPARPGRAEPCEGWAQSTIPYANLAGRSRVKTILAIAGALVVLGGGFAFIRTTWGVWRKVSAFIDEVVGEPAQFGRKAKPGVIQRMDTQGALLASLNYEMHPNGSRSMRDAVDRLELGVRDAATTAAQVKADLTAYTDRSEDRFDEQSKAIQSLAEAVKIAAQSTPPHDSHGG